MSRKLTSWLLTLGVVGASGGLGWALMKLISPTREDMLKILPESDPKILSESQRRSQAFLDAIKAAAEDPRPIHTTLSPHTLTKKD